MVDSSKTNRVWDFWSRSSKIFGAPLPKTALQNAKWVLQKLLPPCSKMSTLRTTHFFHFFCPAPQGAICPMPRRPASPPSAAPLSSSAPHVSRPTTLPTLWARCSGVGAPGGGDSGQQVHITFTLHNCNNAMYLHLNSRTLIPRGQKRSSRTASGRPCCPARPSSPAAWVAELGCRLPSRVRSYCPLKKGDLWVTDRRLPCTDFWRTWFLEDRSSKILESALQKSNTQSIPALLPCGSPSST